MNLAFVDPFLYTSAIYLPHANDMNRNVYYGAVLLKANMFKATLSQQINFKWMVWVIGMKIIKLNDY